MQEAQSPSHRCPGSSTVRRPSSLRGPDGADALRKGHEQAEERLAIAVVTVVVACDVGSFSAFPNAAMNELRAALPAGDVSVASSFVSRVT